MDGGFPDIAFLRRLMDGDIDWEGDKDLRRMNATRDHFLLEGAEMRSFLAERIALREREGNAEGLEHALDILLLMDYGIRKGIKESKEEKK